MNFLDATREALALLISGDTALWQIIAVSIGVSFAALLIATPPAVLLGFAVATQRFRGRRAVVILMQSVLSFPTVVVGLILYLLLTRSGPLGQFQLHRVKNARNGGGIFRRLGDRRRRQQQKCDT